MTLSRAFPKLYSALLIDFCYTGLFNTSVFQIFFESICILFSMLSDAFSLTSQPYLLLHEFLLPTLGGNRKNGRDCDISEFVSSSPQYLNPFGVLRWTQYKANEAKKKKIPKTRNNNNKIFPAALAQIARFKLCLPVLKPPNDPKSLFPKPHGYMFTFCQILPPLCPTRAIASGIYSKEQGHNTRPSLLAPLPLTAVCWEWYLWLLLKCRGYACVYTFKEVFFSSPEEMLLHLLTCTSVPSTGSIN